MRCGRCRASGADITHVRACYEIRPTTEVPVRTDVSRPVERIVLKPTTAGSRSTVGGDDHDEWWAADLRAASSLGMDVIGMDADGRSAWMRSVEDEYGIKVLSFELPPPSFED